jgi:capsule polysaccharide export protein KpsE/RkpR
MEHEEHFLALISTDLEELRSKLDEKLDAIQNQLDTLQDNQDVSPYRQDLYTLADRIDSARVHMHVAMEYLKGNGERAFIQDREPALGRILAMQA